MALILKAEGVDRPDNLVFQAYKTAAYMHWFDKIVVSTCALESCLEAPHHISRGRITFFLEFIDNQTSLMISSGRAITLVLLLASSTRKLIAE
jgi:hypothetical protein